MFGRNHDLLCLNSPQAYLSLIRLALSNEITASVLMRALAVAGQHFHAPAAAHKAMAIFQQNKNLGGSASNRSGTRNGIWLLTVLKAALALRIEQALDLDRGVGIASYAAADHIKRLIALLGAGDLDGGRIDAWAEPRHLEAAFAICID
jgi:hypothetical protein